MRLAILLSVAVLSFAQVQVEWQRSVEAFAGKNVEVFMADGRKLKGSWTQVSDDSFTMGIEGKGVQTYPRKEIRKVKISDRRIRGKVIGTLGGFYSVVAIAAAANGASDSLQGGFGVAALGGGVAGFFAGRSFDRNTREVSLR